MGFPYVVINGVLQIAGLTGATFDAPIFTSGATLSSGTLAMGANPIQFTNISVLNGGTNILDIRNGTNAEVLRLYNTFTGSTNLEALEMNWQTTANVMTIRNVKGSAAGTARVLRFEYGGANADGAATSIALQIPASAATQVDIGVVGLSAATTAGVLAIGRTGSSTATSGTNLVLSIPHSAAPTATSTMVFIPLSITPTINYSNVTPGAGSYEAIRVAVTETALPTGTNYLLRLLAGAAGATEKFSVTNAGLTTWADAANLVFGSTTGTKIGTATTQKLGFFNATPIVQPSAYTQTYATADKTHAALTSATLTDNTAGTANTTLEALVSGSVYATDVAAIRNNFADLAASNNAIIVDLTDLKQLVNSVIDDLQALGLAA